MQQDEILARLREVEKDVAVVQVEVRNLSEKMKAMISGISRLLWIIGGGLISAIVAWIVGGGLGA